MSSLEQMYQQVILDHARERHGTGDPSSLAASSHQVNPTCGDETTLGVTLSDSGQIEALTCGMVMAARFRRHPSQCSLTW